jgi:hypothetical protein
MSTDSANPGNLPFKIPTPENTKGTWVQTERKAHEAWAQLVLKNGRAAALLHLLVSRMGDRNAVVISRATLAQMLGCSEATVKRASRDLRADNWIQTVALGGKGGVNAYVINRQVAWQQDRSLMHLAVFDATIIASADEQDPDIQETIDLRPIPTLKPGELQLPMGPGEEPPSQPALEGLEPDLPALQAPKDPPPAGHEHLALPGDAKGPLTESELSIMRGLLSRIEAVKW